MCAAMNRLQVETKFPERARCATPNEKPSVDLSKEG